MEASLREEIAALLDAEIRDVEAVGGGDIGESWRVVLSSGEGYFVKNYRDSASDLAQCEADGLHWLEEAEALETARVAGVLEDAPVLILHWIEAAGPGPDFAEKLGRGLAKLHAFGAPEFGFTGPNYIGSLPQENESCERWADFYGYRRLEPLLRSARDARVLEASLVREADRLLGRLDSLCGAPESPARLHGDLWSGNLLCNEAGAPVLIDPAVYGGHREVDLAMMRLFGGFSEATFDAYANEFPLAEEFEERIPLYQLYPLLVHVNLFGGSYADSFARALRHYR
jgi:fructosamine-3-kinase